MEKLKQQKQFKRSCYNWIKTNKTIFDLIEMSKSQFEKALPKHLTSEKIHKSGY